MRGETTGDIYWHQAGQGRWFHRYITYRMRQGAMPGWAKDTMDDTRFDVEAVFAADDYHYFYDAVLTPERTAREVDLIWRLLDLENGVNVLDLACGHGRIANSLAAR